MNRYVADTCALFWDLTNSPKLGPKARSAFGEGERGEAEIYIPAIVLAELYYLNAKQGHPLDFSNVMQELEEGSQFRLVPFLPDQVLDFDADQTVPEMHDRMIAGVARRLGAPLLTCDPKIIASGRVTVIW